jgi:hypothetical protein
LVEPVSALDDFARATRLYARERVRIHRHDRVAQFFTHVEVPGGSPVLMPQPPVGGGVTRFLGKTTPFERTVIEAARSAGARFVAMGGESAFSPEGGVPVVTAEDRLDVLGAELVAGFTVVIHSHEASVGWAAEYRPNGTLGAWQGGWGWGMACHNDKTALRAALRPAVGAGT